MSQAGGNRTGESGGTSCAQSRSLIVKHRRCILPGMATSAKPKLKPVERTVATAKPTGKPIDVDAGLARVMARFPRIMARLGE